MLVNSALCLYAVKSQQQHHKLALSPSTPTCQRELQKASSSLSLTKGNKSLPMSRSPHSATVRQSPTFSICIMSEETPGRLCKKEKTNCDTRRGLHFQSPAVESSSEDEDVPVQDNPEVPHGNCCRKQRFDNEALRNRLQKVGRRLEIACKRFYLFCLPLSFDVAVILQDWLSPLFYPATHLLSFITEML